MRKLNIAISDEGGVNLDKFQKERGYNQDTAIDVLAKAIPKLMEKGEI